MYFILISKKDKYTQIALKKKKKKKKKKNEKMKNTFIIRHRNYLKFNNEYF